MLYECSLERMGFTQSHLVPNVGKIQGIVVDLFGDSKGLALGVWMMKSEF